MKRTKLFSQMKDGDSAILEKNSGLRSDSYAEENISPPATRSKLSFQNLARNFTNPRKYQSTLPKVRKLRATVNLEMMKEELKQLEDPPVTEEEKEISCKRLQYSFFDVPCIDLAQKLLGKILVRRLENGTILKGRIVETEAYIGEIDKASQTYGGKVTPRILPMYMPPGTIYVYIVYGMYHCFNITSAESGSYVLVSALEVLGDTDYVELLRNSESKIGKEVKIMTESIESILPYELCNEPWKICTAFAIDLDDLSDKKLWNSNVIWLENDSTLSPVYIVVAPSVSNSQRKFNNLSKLENHFRYYVLDNPCVRNRDAKLEERKGCATLLRALEPIEGMDEMRSYRSAASKPRKESQKEPNILRNHDLCNGPSKLCIAFQIEKAHCKYSMCNFKSLWIENDENQMQVKIIKSSRIGIDSAGPEWAKKPLRYYIYGNTSVSKRDKKAEAEAIGCE